MKNKDLKFMEEINQNNQDKIIAIKKAIIRVIVFFDMFDYPLTLYEIWRAFSIKCELVEVSNVLEIGLDGISSQNGFYFLSGKEKNIKERLSRYNFTDRKFKKAMFVAKIFKFIPWIKMIAIGNLLGAHNLKDNSDIDFFIITDDKRIWITRFFCVSIVKFFGLRPSKNNRRDKICLSFYANLSALNLEKLRIDQNDLYFVYWLAGLTPIYDKEKTYKKFIQANEWFKAYLPNWDEKICLDRRTIKSKQFLFYNNIVNLFLDYLEKKLKVLQLKLLPQKLKNMMNRDSRVVINDQIIKLHSSDRREEYRKKYLELI